ncbi:MAG: translation initiation factor [Steroidobacteraceae bacterium]
MKPKYTFRGAVIRTGPGRARPRGEIAPAGGSSARGEGRSGPPRIRVSREVAGRAGKGVSVISGLPLCRAELDALAAQLKRLCGAGGGVRDGRIEIQGEHRDKLLAELVKLGFDAKRAGG